MSKLEKGGKFTPFRPWTITCTFRAIQSYPALCSWLVELYHPWEISCQNREKVPDQLFWANGLKCKKGIILTFKNDLQPNHQQYDMLLMSFQWSFMPKTLLKHFWDWHFFPLLQDDANANDGQVGIWKAPLRLGTAELNTQLPRFDL